MGIQDIEDSETCLELWNNKPSFWSI